MPVPHYKLTDNDVLYYLHTPKTAGTSFTHVILNHFEPDEVYQPTTIYDFLLTPPEVGERTRFLVGHLFYDVKPVITRNTVYITMLRDPVERTISDYAQIKRTPEHYAYERTKDQSLLEFVKDPLNQFIFTNVQTRQIGLDLNIHAMGAELDESVRFAEFGQRVHDYTASRYFDPTVLERAQERLEKFAFVGLVERFKESVDLLCDTFGWDAPQSSRVLNVSTNRPTDIPQEALDVIHENTRQDTALYETGKRLFEERYQQMLAEHPERARKPVAINLDPSIQGLAYQRSLIDKLEADNAALEAQVNKYDSDMKRLSEELARLSQIENSFGWRFILRASALRRKLIPEGSTIENIYRKIRNRFA